MIHALRATAMRSTLLALAVAGTASAQVAPAAGPGEPEAPGFRAAHPGSGILASGGQVARVWGNFSSGATPAESAKRFIDSYGQELFGVGADQLLPVGPFETGEHLVQVMPDREVGGFKFTGVCFSQHVQGVPVYKSHLLVLCRNDRGFPAVLASSTLWNVEGVEEQLKGITPGVLPDARVWTRNALSQFRAQPEVGPAQYVIWAGVDRQAADPRLAVLFTAEGGGNWDPDNHQRIEFVVDARTGAILHQESKIYHAVGGQVTGLVTAGNDADACAEELPTGLPYVEVRTGGTIAYADVNGNYSIAAGAAGATYTTRLAGRYFTTTNNSAATLSLSTTADDGATWSPLFNAANAIETDRAQVNAYYHANLIRDLVLVANPTYPTVATQASSFSVNANLANTCNAYYSGNTINFYSSGGGCANTAFGTVVHHEYGHNVVAKGGSGQGAYGEGMGDVCGFLVSDDPRTGIGFYQGNCTSGIRTADNTCIYDATNCSSCGSEIHACGRLIAGCFWDLRDRLAAAYPGSYRTMLADLAINSVLLHGAVTTINSEITIDVLTLDDDNGNLLDGSPNYQLINDSFALHGMPGPALQLLNFTYPDGVPEFVAPNGTTPLRVRIDALGSQPNLWTPRMYSRPAGAGTWTVTSLVPVSGNLFTINMPGGDCLSRQEFYVACNTTDGAVASDPPTAPITFRTATVATGISPVLSLDFEAANAGWTVGATGDTATGGLWVKADPFGTSYGTTGAKCQPEDDHTASPGVQAWITGNTTAAGTNSTTRNAADVDGGTTTLTSPAIDLSAAADARIAYWIWFACWQANNSPSTGDTLVIQASNDNGSTWTTVDTISSNAGAWSERGFRTSSFFAPPLSAQFRVRFRATDAGTESVVEAGVDDFRVDAIDCTVTNPADLDGDGHVGGSDLAILLSNWGGPGAGDLDNNGTITGNDLAMLLSSWG